MSVSPRFLLLCCGLPLTLALGGCANDGAAYHVDGTRHAISVERRQDYFWDKRLHYAVVVSRLPDCQRKHAIPGTFTARTPVELWQPGPHTYIVRIGKAVYVTESQTCEGFAPLEETPPNGYGQRLGLFSVKKGQFVFTPAPAEASASPSDKAAPPAPTASGAK